ncbi:MAG: AAA family ATPase, partial [Candidatus Omnitrophota bacterium]
MEYILRQQEQQIRHAIERNKSVLLLGPRQTGKTTLIQRIPTDLAISLVTPEIRLRYEKEPGIMRKEIEALESKGTNRPVVVLDEVQKVPDLLNVAQDLIDRQKANFILTGSSARKLRRGHDLNLLPGRVITLRLDPFTLKESMPTKLEEGLLYGALPGIVAVESLQDREIDLESYVTLYLEQEVRAEALVRNLASFARFVEWAAAESGRISNFRKISQEIGV